MSKNSKKSLDHLFNSENHTLRNVVDKVYFISGVNDVLQTLLPDNLVDHCYVSNIRDGCIVISTASPSWATPLRYCFPELLQKLRSYPGLESLRQIELKIIPESKQVNYKRNGNKLTLSSSVASDLQQTADSISDPDLRAVLNKLASHSE